MKKCLALIMLTVFLLSCWGCTQAKEEKGQTKKEEKTINYTENMKAVWLSYYEIEALFSSLNEAQAQKKCESIFSLLAQKGINTVFFHVRAFADAFYSSKYFPLSRYCPEGYDVLKLAVESAHKNKISLHAWVNPYRVALDTTLDALPAESPAVKLYAEDAANLILVDKNIFFNPASIKVQQLILSGIREILEHYAVDGVHFDDYFYPSDSEEIDKESYAAYKNNGGNMNLSDFRRENVSNLIAAVHGLVKGKNDSLLFGVSPQCFIEKNRDLLFADIETWVQRESVDYLLPQIYFGFENESAPFCTCVDTWVEFLQKKPVKLYVGLALYKSGKEDAYASEDSENQQSAYYEWMNHSDIIAREMEYLHSCGIKGYSLYSYASLMENAENENMEKEVQNLLPQLKE
ncbi:MAG: family 10 glycosylhydrolase [Clostridia bacterium]|nr:family 10 glycosylhydrolase [Clostridia bacterium]